MKQLTNRIRNAFGRMNEAANPEKPYIQVITQVLFLAALGVYLFYRVMYNNLYVIEYDKNFLWGIMVWITAAAMLRIGYSKAAKGWWWLLACVLGALLGMSWLGGERSYQFLIFLAVCMSGAAGMPFRRVAKVGFWTTLSIVLASYVGSIIGVVEELVYVKEGAVKHSFGISYTTDSAAYVFFLVVTFWIAYEEVSHLWTTLLSLLMAVFVHQYWHATCSTMLLLLTAASSLFLFLQERYGEGEWRKSRFWIGFWKVLKHIVDVVLVIGMPVFAGGMIFACYQYGITGLGRWQKLDALLHYRLTFAYKALENLEIKPFGQMFTMIGAGGTTLEPANYSYVDSSYVLILIRYGWVILVAFCILYMVIQIRAIKSGNYRLAFAFFLVAFHSVEEQHLLEVNYNLLWLAAFACIAPKMDVKTSTKPSSLFKSFITYWTGNRIINLIVWGLAAAAFWVTKSHISAFGRTIARILGWDGSDYPGSLGVLATIVGLFALTGCFLWGLCKVLQTLFVGRQNVAALAGDNGANKTERADQSEKADRSERTKRKTLQLITYLAVTLLPLAALCVLFCLSTGVVSSGLDAKYEIIKAVEEEDDAETNTEEDANSSSDDSFDEAIVDDGYQDLDRMDDAIISGESMADVDRLLAMADEESEQSAKTFLTVIHQEKELLTDLVALNACPVYVDEVPLLYDKVVDGLSHHVFFGNSLAGEENVAILTTAKSAQLALVKKGFLMTQVSPEHSIYTNCPEVIRYLEAAGFTMTDYDAVTRYVDLEEQADRNDLYTILDGTQLAVYDSNHSMVHGPYIDLSAGIYEFTFSYELYDTTETDPKKHIGWTWIASDKGENLLAESKINLGALTGWSQQEIDAWIEECEVNQEALWLYAQQQAVWEGTTEELKREDYLSVLNLSEYHAERNEETGRIRVTVSYEVELSQDTEDIEMLLTCKNGTVLLVDALTYRQIGVVDR